MNSNQAIASDVPRSSFQFASEILQNVFGKKTNEAGEHFPNEIPMTSENTANANTVGQILTRLENRKEQAAVNLGIGAGDVETMPFDLSALETEGIFLNIDCGGFGALERQLEWKSLGVELPPAGAVRVSAPRAGLLPDVYRKKLMRAAAQAHNALDRYSFRFALCETVLGSSEYKWMGAAQCRIATLD